MLVTKEVEIYIDSKKIQYYKEKGYDVKAKKYHKIKIEHLSKGCGVEVDVICDVCGKEKKIKYRDYLKNIKNVELYCCSRKCAVEKRTLINKEKYGISNTFQRKDVIEKTKKTKLDKYGDENYVNPEKAKQTSLEKYGTIYPQSCDFVKNKTIETNLNKYGAKHLSELKIYLDKAKKTKLDKYGDENYVNIEKAKRTCLEKYGTDNWMKSEEFKNKQTNKSSSKYSCSIIDIKLGKYYIKCFKCGNIFDIKINNLIKRKDYGINYCTICNPINEKTSHPEKELKKFIQEHYNGIIEYRKRNIINPYEIDIYIPELKLAFEFNGIYWHNELYKDKNYHLNKTESTEKQNIRLIQIYQDDWLYKQDIIKSRILNLLNKSNKIYARNCDIRKIEDNSIIREFLNKNHLQGFIGSKIKIGLFHKGELVSLMTFGNLRKSMGQRSSDGKYEMLRFCNKLNTNVVGGASRLFKYFIENYKPLEIISYADRSWSQGKLYEKLGFKLICKTQPNYYYVIDGIRKHRFGFRKDKLIKEGTDPNKSEHEIMLDKKIYRIYDSGHLKFNYIK